MRQFNEYSIIIFDCDGVIFNSNNLKVEAMGEALLEIGFPPEEVYLCQNLFSKNFGKSRFYHVDIFLNEVLDVEEKHRYGYRERILSSYSSKCSELYMAADFAPFIIDLLQNNQAAKYIASGSEQQELRSIIKARGLSSYFKSVYGSPRRKSDLVADVLSCEGSCSAVMIGDARSDLEAARSNSIDFIYYSPFSNVDLVMRELCVYYNYRILDSFKEVINE